MSNATLREQFSGVSATEISFVCYLNRNSHFSKKENLISTPSLAKSCQDALAGEHDGFSFSKEGFIFFFFLILFKRFGKSGSPYENVEELL